MELHLKYRPKTFDQIVGNQEVVEILSNMIKNEECPHSILLTGPTGCGKTTLARIISNELGCKGADFKEIDIADFRGIDMAREIRRNSAYKPISGPCRVWVLDEAHELTTQAQDALLKILEDTPKHVYFILCTTESQKLKPTLRGRCSTYDVKTLTDREMKSLLKDVVKGEDESLEKPVFQQIIQDADGHPRNALQVLNQVLQVEEDNRLKTAERSAAVVSQSIELCRVLLNEETTWRKVATILKGLKQQDPEKIRRHVLAYCVSVLLKNTHNRAGLILEQFAEPYYNTGFNGLVLSCYTVIEGE